MEHRFDYLIIGSGIAGLFFALKVVANDPGARLAIVTKKRETDSNTNYAQGGIAAVLARTDSFKAHIEDTLRTGCGLCDPEVVEHVVEAGPNVIGELLSYGVRFTRSDNGFDLGREGGHSANRVAHASDLTGREIERALLGAARSMPNNISMFRNHMAVDLLTTTLNGQRQCVGAMVLSDEETGPEQFISPVTLLATGGLGQIYYHTSNPKIATGDGIAIAHRAGVPVANLEFIQFHPTTLYAPGRRPFLISEAVRGEGGRLRSREGTYFMEGAHPLKDLAPRDVVARAIDKQLKKSGDDFVLLDVSHREKDYLQKRFPNIYKNCLRYGFDITRGPVPVVPAAHYSCGGVMAHIHGETDLPGLFVAGEVAMTGMHGSNRLASNSLLEAVVMAGFGAQLATTYRRSVELPATFPIDEVPKTAAGNPYEKIVIAHTRRELQQVMSDFVGIVRTQDRMERALDKVRAMRDAIEDQYANARLSYQLAELRNMVMTSELVILSALHRHESRGLHFVEEYPDTLDDWKINTVIKGLTINGDAA